MLVFSGALNTGYYLSSGEYIAVQDADDLSHPNRFEKTSELLKNESRPCVDWDKL
ncbi:glycosyltransferase family A protein [Peribacillus frigoritolerans]|nr:glycosyltransferase family A protein [Peribacillus frigoritolerans]